MSFSGIFTTVVLLGAVQGFIVSSLLFFSKGKRLSGRLLGILIFLIALASLNIYLNTRLWFVNSSVLQVFHALIPWVMVMPMGPLIYFYLHSCLDPDFKLSKKDRRHFYPVLLDIVPQIAVLLFLIAAACGFHKITGTAIGYFIDTYNVYADIPRWLSMSFYVMLSYKYLTKLAVKSKIEVTFNVTDYKWLKHFIHLFIGFQVIWLFHLVPYLIPATRYKLLDAVDWYPVYVPLTVLIYILGIRGYLQTQNIASQVKKEKRSSLLPEALITEAVSVLRHSMEQDKLYLDPALNLAALAKHTGMAPKVISAVLNQHLNKSFNDFINEFRIGEVKERLLLPQNKNLTIAGLAYECGFNSLPTFQRTFKTIVGMSPTEYIAKACKTDKSLL